MRILITGAAGMLGQALRERLAPAHALYLWTREEAELAVEAAVRAAAAPLAFDAVIHAAAMTDVDGCEREPDRAMASNREAARIIASLAATRRAVLVLLSTDYVFDGSQRNPYREEDPPHPINAYGRSKRLGEEAALASGAELLIVRTSWLFGPGGRNFVDSIAARLERDEPLEVVDDQEGSPTYTFDLAEGIERLLRKGARGLVHVTNGGSTTWYGLACAVAQWLGRSAPIRPTTSDQIARPARRPAYSVLSGERYRSIAGASLPPWRDALDRHMSHRRGAAVRTG